MKLLLSPFGLSKFLVGSSDRRESKFGEARVVQDVPQQTSESEKKAIGPDMRTPVGIVGFISLVFRALLVLVLVGETT